MRLAGKHLRKDQIAEIRIADYAQYIDYLKSVRILNPYLRSCSIKNNLPHNTKTAFPGLMIDLFQQ